MKKWVGEPSPDPGEPSPDPHDPHDLVLGRAAGLHTERPRDIRYGIIIFGAQLLARSTVGVPDLVAVDEVYGLRGVVVVVVDIGDAPALVGNQHLARHDVAAGYILSLTQGGTEECRQKDYQNPDMS